MSGPIHVLFLLGINSEPKVLVVYLSWRGILILIWCACCYYSFVNIFLVVHLRHCSWICWYVFHVAVFYTSEYYTGIDAAFLFLSLYYNCLLPVLGLDSQGLRYYLYSLYYLFLTYDDCSHICTYSSYVGYYLDLLAKNF